ncbi:MAG: glycine cleavage system protein GcvH [Ardenticatenaceae bacterium]|nr:glycine cleavage system protein GcvH [Ardenticatenaceae bacterium]
MISTPENLRYSKEDEWILVEGDVATIGITDYAQDSLADIVYLELPDVGDSVSNGDTFGVVESVKAASDLYAPVSGEVVEVNDDLVDTPESINEDPYGAAWMVKIKMSDPSELDGLMDAAGYLAYNESR